MDLIVAEPAPKAGLGRVIMDRLHRARLRAPITDDEAKAIIDYLAKEYGT